jgi:hypothetical protein
MQHVGERPTTIPAVFASLEMLLPIKLKKLN